jgi:hypothetical protein
MTDRHWIAVLVVAAFVLVAVDTGLLVWLAVRCAMTLREP